MATIRTIAYDKNATTNAIIFHFIIIFALLTLSESPEENIKKYPATMNATAAMMGIIKSNISDILVNSDLIAPTPPAGLEPPHIGSMAHRSTVKLLLVRSLLAYTHRCICVKRITIIAIM